MCSATNRCVFSYSNAVDYHRNLGRSPKTGGRWRTHPQRARVESLARGWAVLVASPTEEFVSSSSL
jgi:hypothetical protein